MIKAVSKVLGKNEDYSILSKKISNSYNIKYKRK